MKSLRGTFSMLSSVFRNPMNSMDFSIKRSCSKASNSFREDVSVEIDRVGVLISVFVLVSCVFALDTVFAVAEGAVTRFVVVGPVFSGTEVLIIESRSLKVSTEVLVMESQVESVVVDTGDGVCVRVVGGVESVGEGIGIDSGIVARSTSGGCP